MTGGRALADRQFQSPAIESVITRVRAQIADSVLAAMFELCFPATLDLIGIKAPEEIRGIKQHPFEGMPLAYSIDDGKAPSRHTLQYYYIFGSRSIYDNGWKTELAYPNDVETKHALSNPPLDENA
jgi:arylsulfatase A-like enzyme